MRMVRVPLNTGESIVVEAPDDDSGVVRVARGGGIADAAQSLESSMAPIQTAVRHVLDSFANIADGLDEVEINFGVRLYTELGAAIVKGGGEGHFAVTLKWVRPKETSGGA